MIFASGSFCTQGRLFKLKKHWDVRPGPLRCYKLTPTHYNFKSFAYEYRLPGLANIVVTAVKGQVCCLMW